MTATLLHFRQPPLSIDEIEAFTAIRSPYPCYDVFMEDGGLTIILGTDTTGPNLALQEVYIAPAELGSALYPLALLALRIDEAVKQLDAGREA
jgi:hypothetical protein